MADSGDRARDHIDTRLAHAGHDPRGFFGFVQPPVVHASTVLFEDAQTYRTGGQRYVYGRRGTPTTDALAAMVSEIEGAEGTVLVPSGLAACAFAITASVKSGDRILISDTVYSPTRRFCLQLLSRFGVETAFFDPMDVASLERLLGDGAAAVYLEAPGSLTFEVPDLGALIAAAHAAGALVLFDNTWATPLYFAPLAHGIDMSITAATKYFSGSSDLLIGTIAANGEALARVRDTANLFGSNVGPDDVYLTLRGIRSLSIRLDRHNQNGVTVARWLEQRPEIHRVLHPALESSPGHANWRRYFSGSSGLFAAVFRDVSQDAVDAFIDGLRLFGIGASWGGFESLVTAPDVSKTRSVAGWDPRDQLVRFHIGLENPDDLIADLDQALDALRKTASNAA